MALAPRDTPVTRDNVEQWLKQWRALKDKNKKPWQEFLRAKVDALNISDPMVNTSEHEDLGPETHVVDMILADMDSYG